MERQEQEQEQEEQEEEQEEQEQREEEEEEEKKDMDTIFDAVKQNNLQKLIKLIRKGVSIDTVERGNYTLLMHFFRFFCGNNSDEYKILHILLHTNDINSKNHVGNTCLFYAIWNKQVTLDILYLLFERGVDIYCKNIWGITPFLYSCWYSNMYVIKMLYIMDKQLIYDKDDCNQDILFYAKINEDKNVLNYCKKLYSM